MPDIPFQCSLGVATEHFRDDVFTTAWEDENIGKKFFNSRLSKLLYELNDKSKNVVIVNACTKNKDDSNENSGRKTKVTDIILDLIKNKSAQINS